MIPCKSYLNSFIRRDTRAALHNMLSGVLSKQPGIWITYSSDSTKNGLKKFMASLTGKTFTIKSKKDYKTNYYAPPKEKVGGNFEYSFTKPQDIQIAMFDKKRDFEFVNCSIKKRYQPHTQTQL